MKLGDTVVYRLTEEDAAKINRRRTTGNSIAERLASDDWPQGAQAHIGSRVSAGLDFPMIVVRYRQSGEVDHPGYPSCSVANGQVILDGSDTLWVRNVTEGPHPGQYRLQS